MPISPVLFLHTMGGAGGFQALLTGTEAEHRTLGEHTVWPGNRTMPRLMRDMLSLASCGGFVWMAWTLAFSVTAA